MNVEPLGARVLVRPVEQETVTKAGIVLPDTVKEKPQQGMIEAVGSADALTTDLKVGDKVLFAKYSGNEITVDGVDYLLMEETDILARIKA